MLLIPAVASQDPYCNRPMHRLAVLRTIYSSPRSSLSSNWAGLALAPDTLPDPAILRKLVTAASTHVQAKAADPHGVASPDSSHTRHRSTPFRLQSGITANPQNDSHVPLPCEVTRCTDSQLPAIRRGSASAILPSSTRSLRHIHDRKCRVGWWAGGQVGHFTCGECPIAPGECFVVPLLAALAAAWVSHCRLLQFLGSAGLELDAVSVGSRPKSYSKQGAVLVRLFRTARLKFRAVLRQ